MSEQLKAQAVEVVKAIAAELRERNHTVTVRPQGVFDFHHPPLVVDGIEVRLTFRGRFGVGYHPPGTMGKLQAQFDSVYDWVSVKGSVLRARSFQRSTAVSAGHGFDTAKMAAHAERWVRCTSEVQAKVAAHERAEARLTQIADQVIAKTPRQAWRVHVGKTGLGITGLHDGLSQARAEAILRAIEETEEESQATTDPESAP